jgi:hypothetical protein
MAPATWGAILALYYRYPRHLEHLKTGWWNDDAHTETLAALAHWRHELDTTTPDPRQELIFHTQLNDYAKTLQQQHGSTTQRWQPGPPPNEWAKR